MTTVTNIIEGGQEFDSIHTVLKRIRFTVDLLEDNPEICNEHYSEYIHNMVSDTNLLVQLRNAFCKEHKGEFI